MKFRTFLLVRKVDVSGISGTGVIAEGVQFPDGTVVLHWPGEWPTTTIHERGIESIEHIHGHHGLTTVMWEVESISAFGEKSD